MPPCLHCGRELSPRATVCPECGEPGPAPPAAQPGSVASVMAAVPRTEPFAIASIVCAVANFLGAFLIGAILAIVFGKIAQKNIDQNPALEGANLARMGTIIGWVGIAVFVGVILLGIAFLGVFSSSTSTEIRVPAN